MLAPLGAALRRNWALVVSCLSAAVLLLMAGVIWGRSARIHDRFPEPVLKAASEALSQARDQLSGKLPDYLVRTGPEAKVVGAARGDTLISTVSAKGELYVALIDPQGRETHRWNTDWFRIWPDAKHVPDAIKPRERPGTEVEGMVLYPDGDLVFSFENLGMVRMDWCGKVKWRVPRLTHHTVTLAEDGSIWAPAMIKHDKADPRLPNFIPPFDEPTLVQVSPEGRVLREISVIDVLRANDLQGVLYLSTRDNYSTRVDADTLHLNDIDVFPSGLKPGVAGPGDLLISLRNANAILLLDARTLKVKALVRDGFVRQHDPDFIDGDHIAVFDNNNVSERPGEAQSRLVIADLRTGQIRPVFSGSAGVPFYTRYMGREQHLAQGGWLLTEAAQGRLVEIDETGKVRWEYRNIAAPGVRAQLFDAERIERPINPPQCR